MSDTFARISWNADDSQQDSQFYVAYMNNRKLSSPALSCLDAVFFKQTIKVTTKSIKVLNLSLMGANNLKILDLYPVCVLDGVNCYVFDVCAL